MTTYPDSSEEPQQDFSDDPTSWRVCMICQDYDGLTRSGGLYCQGCVEDRVSARILESKILT